MDAISDELTPFVEEYIKEMPEILNNVSAPLPQPICKSSQLFNGNTINADPIIPNTEKMSIGLMEKKISKKINKMGYWRTCRPSNVYLHKTQLGGVNKLMKSLKLQTIKFNDEKKFPRKPIPNTTPKNTLAELMEVSVKEDTNGQQ